MKKLLMSGVFGVLMLFVFHVNSSVALVILQYHHVSDKTPASTSVTPALFEQHLAYLETNSFQVLDLSEVRALLEANKPLPERAVAITFDDGYLSVYKTAFPMLAKRKWPFTVFINSQPHDEKNPSYMSWAQLQELARAGVSIGNHTDSHAHLIRRATSESFNEFALRREQEIDFAERRILKELSVNSKLFAYPFGEYDQDLKAMLAKKGYIAFGQQSGPVPAKVDLQAIPRFPFGGNYGDVDDFAIKVNSTSVPQLSFRVETESGVAIKNAELPLDTTRPVLYLSSPIIPHLQPFTCYASGQGMIDAKEKGSAIRVQAKQPLPIGRSKYNCTSPTGDGRYYWWSQLFIRRNNDGTWGHN